MTGCASGKYPMPYTADSNISSFRMIKSQSSITTATPFTAKLCVGDNDVDPSAINISSGSYAGLFDIYDKKILYGKNIHQRLNPASLTKIMTAIVALKNGSADMILTATSNVTLKEYDAQKMDLKPGDTMTLSQALNILLLYSANDVAILIAEGIAGSQDAFVEMMNKEAASIGATNTHFVNPHGLTADDHYTTVYDMYLIMNDAMQFELFNEIIHTSEYSTVYHDSAGMDKEISIKSTNLYITGAKETPSGITIVGGKTGTTSAAGHCLVLLSRDTRSNPFISIVMKSDNREELYDNMTLLLDHIGN
ncbi:MAG: D-alanyl-D-alanine carboxypeptidase [Lachnospiraceae bacterium]|nr:D-alanyl-D-alanine carboxypeptidase [Lachnospiraceae bacterium]